MTPDVRLIMPCTQLNWSNSRLKVPFVKSAHKCVQDRIGRSSERKWNLDKN